MTGTIVPAAAPAVPTVGHPTTPVDRIGADRAAPFGPALARAHEQVSRRSSEATEAADHTADSRPDSPGPKVTSGDETRRSNSTGDDPPSEDTTAHDATADESDAVRSDTESSDGSLSDAESSDSEAGESSETPSLETPSSEAASSAAESVNAALSQAASSGAAGERDRESVGSAESDTDGASVTDPSTVGAHVAGDHPTAKGEHGDGGPSTTPLVEGTAPPIESSVRPAPADDASTTADAEVTSSATIADSIRGVTTADSAGTSNAGAGASNAGAGTATQQTPGSGTPTAAAGTVGGAGRPEADSTAPAVVATGIGQTTPVSPEPTDVALPVSMAAAEEPAAAPAHRTSVVSDGAEGLVVLASEAGRVTETGRSAAATPTPGPLQTAEGSLWEDVRLAFDRIRSSGDGREVRIRLRPAELGELVVHVRTQGEQVAVRLTASSQAAQQALLDDRLRLATELARAGFEEGSVDIGRDDGGGLGQPRQGTDGEHGRGRVAAQVPGPAARSALERRDPIRTDSGIRPGRYAYSTINLTL